jgi:hypothetical protein
LAESGEKASLQEAVWQLGNTICSLIVARALRCKLTVLVAAASNMSKQAAAAIEKIARVTTLCPMLVS